MKRTGSNGNPPCFYTRTESSKSPKLSFHVPLRFGRVSKLKVLNLPYVDMWPGLGGQSWNGWSLAKLHSPAMLDIVALPSRFV